MEHIRRVYDAFSAFYNAGCSIIDIDPRIIEIAIILHDTGKGLESSPDHIECGKNHALISEKLFWTFFIPWIDENEKRIVAQAIKWHNKGLRNRGIDTAKTIEDKVAQFLVLFDCMDGLNIPRVRSWAEETGTPEWDDYLSSEEIDAYLASGQKLPEEIKNRSLLNNLLFNLNLLSEDGEVIRPIRHLIGNYEAFREWLEKSKTPAREEIRRILLRKSNEEKYHKLA